jgi:hypothetical protein
MGLSYSTSQHHYAHQITNPRVTPFSEQVMIRMVAVPGEPYFSVREKNPFQRLVSGRDEGQSIYVTAIFLLFVSNECSERVEIDIQNLWNPTDVNVDVPHPDDSGQVKIICPPNYTGSVPLIDRILYKPRLEDELQTYAGLGEAIVKFTVDSETCLLERNHPLCHYMRDNKSILKPERGDFTEQNDEYYLVTREYAERARDLFKNTVHDRMHPTRFEDTVASAKAVATSSQDLPNVICILQINGLLVTPGEQKMRDFVRKI